MTSPEEKLTWAVSVTAIVRVSLASAALTSKMLPVPALTDSLRLSTMLELAKAEDEPATGMALARVGAVVSVACAAAIRPGEPMLAAAAACEKPPSWPTTAGR